MISEVILSLVRSFREPIINILGNKANEIDHLLGDRIPNYLNNISNKFKKTKTFLHRDSLVEFHDTYFPVTLAKNRLIQEGFYGNNEREPEESEFKQDVVEYKYEIEEYKFKTLESFYRNRNYTTIIGRAGSGKSMLMKKIFLTSIEQRIKIPIFIELRILNNYEGELHDFISNEILGLNIAGSTHILDLLLKEGSFLFLFDGYDEIYSDKLDKITQSIESFIDKNSKNWFVISSRKGANIEALNRFENNYITPLKKNEIEGFISQQCKLFGYPSLANSIINEINKPKNIDISDYLEIPLLLSMFILFYRENISIPEVKYDFYSNVYQTILTKHYSYTRPGGWQHKRESDLTNSQITNVLCYLSYRTYFLGQIEFPLEILEQHIEKIISKENLKCSVESIIKDLHKNINILIKDGINYRFPHRSLQEYFTVRRIRNLSIENKINVLSKQLPNHFKKSTDSGENLLDLLIEIDTESVYSYFVLPNLEKLYLKFSNLSIPERVSLIIDKYIESITFKVDFSINDIRILKSKIKVDNEEKLFNYMTGLNFSDCILNQLKAPLTYTKSIKQELIKNYFSINRQDSISFEVYEENKNSLLKFSSYITDEYLYEEKIDLVKILSSTIDSIKTKLQIMKDNQKDLIDLD